MSNSKRIRKHLQGRNGGPRCGRQLSRPTTSAATQDSMQITSELSEVGCRHCLRAIGLLAPITRTGPGEFGEALETEMEDGDEG